MRRRVWLFFLAAVAVCFLSASIERPLFAQPAKTPPKVDMPRTMQIATHPMGTLLFAMGNGLATVLSKNLPAVFKVVPTTGPTEWLPMATSGEVDMGLLNNYDSQMGRLGKGEYKAATGGKGASILLLCAGTPALNAVLVADKSPIRKMADLKGSRYVGIYTGSGGITAQAQGMLANAGLKPSDVKTVSVPGVEAGVRAIIEGKADAAGSTNIGMAAITELDAEKGARLLSIDTSPEAVKRMQQHFPGYVVQVKPGPGMTGVKEPIWVMAYDFYMVAGEVMKEDIAYMIVKTLWEKDKDLAPIHPRLKDWTKDRYVTTKATIPYHPGAVRFYKEAGVWTADMEKLQQRLLAEKTGK